MREKLLLYAVTDRRWLNGASLYEQVEKALQGGVTFMQLREKNLEQAAYIEEAKQMKALCASYHVPFVINDRVDIAQAVGADGVHVGQNDIAPDEARKILGKDKIIGVTARSVEQAVEAEKKGADYLGVGAVFSTSTKLDTRAMSYETLKEICETVSIPVVAIGGIDKNNVRKLAKSGIAGAAVVSAIFAQKEIEDAAKELRKIVETIV